MAERNRRKRVTSRRNKEKMFACARRLMSAAGVFLLAAVIILCVPLTIPRMFGLQIYNVVSGSMEPAIPTGSLVYVKSVEPDKIKTDDVIAFYSSTDRGAIITHRVVAVHSVSGEFITKGDANKEKDPLPVDYDMLLGRVNMSIPFLGEILAMVASVYGKVAVTCMIGVAVILLVLGR